MQEVFHMLRHIVVVSVLMASLVTLVSNAPADLTPAGSRKSFPGVVLTDSKGAPVDLAAYKGRVVLLDFWATWCEGCKEEIPWFMEFQSKYGQKGLTVVGASLDDDGWKSVKPFGVDKGMPVTLLIDRQGKIADVHPGMVDKEAFEREIQALLKESPTKD